MGHNTGNLRAVGLTVKEAGTQLGLSASQAYRLHDKALAHLARLLDEGEA